MANKIKTKQIDGDIAGGIYNCAVDNNVQSSTLGGAASRLASFWKTQTISQVLDAMLFPYQRPTLTLSVEGKSTYEVGESVEDTTLTISWNTTNTSNAVADSITVNDDNATETLGSGLPLIGSLVKTYTPAIVRTTPGSYSWSASGTPTQGSAMTASAGKNWYWKKYWGTASSETLSEALIKGLANKPFQIGNAIADGYPFTGGGYWYFAWPSTANIPTVFKDGNGLKVAMATAAQGYTLTTPSGINYRQITIQNSFNQSTTYNVFRTTNFLGGGDTVAVS